MLETMFTALASDSHTVGEKGETHYLERALAFSEAVGNDSPLAPDWVQIFPKGPKLATVDGRSFAMPDPQAFVDAQGISKAKPVLVDFDHLSSFMPEKNSDQTAAGWIEELSVRDGEIWARIVWTKRAKQQIGDREWRFVSPEFRVNKSTKQVAYLDAVALVNRPAFQMTALAAKQPHLNGEDKMFNAIAKALGLPETAKESEILAAVKVLKEQDGTIDSAEISAVASLLTNLSVERTQSHLARVTDKVNGVIAKAIIPPSVREWATRLCNQDEAAFDEFIAKIGPGLSHITAGQFEKNGRSNLSLEQGYIGRDADRIIAKQLGIKTEDMVK